MVKDADVPTVQSDGPRNMNDLETDGRYTEKYEYIEKSIISIALHAPRTVNNKINIKAHYRMTIKR